MNFHETLGRACCSTRFREALAAGGSSAAAKGGAKLASGEEEAFFDGFKDPASPVAKAMLKSEELLILAKHACRMAPDC